jgi:hypothetical protein
MRCVAAARRRVLRELVQFPVNDHVRLPREVDAIYGPFLPRRDALSGGTVPCAGQLSQEDVIAGKSKSHIN